MKKHKTSLVIVLCTVIIAIGTLVLATPEIFVRYKSDFRFDYIKYEDGIALTRYTGQEKNLIVPSVIDGEKVVSIMGAFYENRNITHIKISEGIEEIGYMSFYFCTSLVSVELPSSVRTIEHAAFKDCLSLNRINLPEGLEAIMPYAFSSCSFLKGVKLPEGLKFIGKNAFENCKSLRKIILPASLEVFGGVTDADISYGEQKGKIKADCFSGCTSLKIKVENANPYFTVADGKVTEK